MMRPDERKEYARTYLYRMIFILSGYRKMISDCGADVANAIRDIWAKDGKVHDTMDKSFMALVDYGYIELGEEEIKAYFDYIYSAYDFPPYKKERAYSNLVQYAKIHSFPDDLNEVPSNIRAMMQAYAMTNLNDILK